MTIVSVGFGTLRYLSRTSASRLLACCCLLPAAAATAQPISLDKAVNAQLEALGGLPCSRLVLGDAGFNLNQFAIGLRQICGRGNPDSGPSTSSGGGAGTAASTPEAVRQRLEGDETLGGEPLVRGVFVTASAGVANRDVTTFQDGYRGDAASLLAGMDREFGAWVGGFTVEYSAEGGQFTGGGDFDTTSIGPTAFAQRSLGDRADLSVYAGFNSLSNERLRFANFTQFTSSGPVANQGGLIYFERDGRPNADFDADEVLGGVQLGFRLTASNLTFRPIIAVDWREADFDSYRETEVSDSGLALIFAGDKRTSLMSTLGLDVSTALSMDFGVVILGGYLNLKQEHDDKQRSVVVSFVDDLRPQPVRFQYQTDPPDAHHVEFGVNAMVLLQGGFQAFVAYEQMASHEFLDSRLYSAGFRKEF